MDAKTQYAKLWDEQKISKTPAPNPTLRGLKLFGRVISVVDGDTAYIATCVNGSLLRFTVRVAHLDCPEMDHEFGEVTVTEHEHKLGCRGKNTVLHHMLPNHFQILDEDVYTWQKQRPIFDANPVMVVLDCSVPEDAKQKSEKYKRELAKISIVKDKNDEKGRDIAEILIEAGLADPYEGGTKVRSFMKNAPKDDKLFQRKKASAKKEPSE